MVGGWKLEAEREGCIRLAVLLCLEKGLSSHESGERATRDKLLLGRHDVENQASIIRDETFRLSRVEISAHSLPWINQESRFDVPVVVMARHRSDAR